MSPLSIYSALSLVLSGAESESKKELISVLHVESPKDSKTMSKLLGENLCSVTAGDVKKTLVQANGIFFQKGTHLMNTFTQIVMEYFKATSKEVRGDCRDDAS